MSVNKNEYLSALVDGELQGADLDWVLEQLAHNPKVQAQFHRYQLASDVMHDTVGFNLSQASQHNLTQRISAALVDEPVYSGSTPNATTESVEDNKVVPFRRGFWKQATGLAMAASLGAVAVLGVTSSQYATGPETTLAANTTSTVQTVSTLNTASNRWTVGEPEVANRLNSYLVNHSEYTGASGAFSYARVVAYEDE
jgi:sigma-E factor negative regulatory protein RseA